MNYILDFSFGHWPIVIGFVAVILAYLSQQRKKFRGIKTRGASVLMTYYSDGAEIMSLTKGVKEGMHYNTFLVAQKDKSLFDLRDSVMYQIELPFKSRIHLVGIPKAPGVIQLNPAIFDSIMEAVVLEGDYPKHFSLFAGNTMQTETRYVLDPKAMVFTVDFCKSHNWEIVDSTLYFLQQGEDHKDDPTFMSEDIKQFVDEIRPAIESPLTEADLIRRAPYGVERRELDCPMCGKALINDSEYLSCPNKHGLLTGGGNLKKLKFSNKHNPNEKLEEENILICPGCKHKMYKVKYNLGKTVIDSCRNCPYRWLDVAEYELKQ